jgi:hypothetical protein
MTDFMAVTFLVTLAVIFMVVSIIMKNTFTAMVSGLCWAVASIYLFSRYYSGDLDYGVTVFGFAWVCALCAFGVLMQSWWTHRRKTLEMTGEKDAFYSSEDIDFSEMREIYKMRDDRNAMRGRKGRR